MITGELKKDRRPLGDSLDGRSHQSAGCHRADDLSDVHSRPKIVSAMDGLYEAMAQLKDVDARGDAYEYLLSKLSTAGVNGQFRTPRHIIRMMVDMTQPKPDELVCENCTTSLIRVAAA